MDRKYVAGFIIMILGAFSTGIIVVRYIDQKTQWDYIILETYEITPTQNHTIPDIYTITVKGNQLHLFTIVGDKILDMRHTQLIQPIPPGPLYIIIDRRENYCKLGLLWNIRGEKTVWMEGIARAGFGQLGDVIIPYPPDEGD